MTQLSNLHEDMIHDCVLDYYGKRLATCSSDKTIKIFEVSGPAGSHRLLATLTGHTGPVWQVSWAHPKFGTLLASASYDGSVIVWAERNGTWTQTATHALHHASVNAVAWGPHEFGAVLAAASSDGRVSVMEMQPDGSWETRAVDAHAAGANAVSWAAATQPGSLAVSGTNTTAPRRFVTGGSDNAVKIWNWSAEQAAYVLEQTLEGHADWVRDVAWAPSILPRSYIASASQDKTVIIWTAESPAGPWKKKVLSLDTVLWRVSWSLSGNVLAVSGGDNKVTLWKETLKGEWEKVQTVEE